jgi:hypothetical protein
MSLSVIMYSRNDNYHGDQYARFPYSINSMITTADEVIYVDWGSQNGIDLVTRCKDNILHMGKLRVIKITPEQVLDLTNHEPNMPVATILSANIAIRRATSDWILSTSTDAFLPRRDLMEPHLTDPVTMTVFSRRELPLSRITSFDPKDSLTIQNWTAEHFREFVAHGYSGAFHGDTWSLIDCCGDFQLLHKDAWNTIRGFEELYPYRGFVDSNLNKKAVLANYKLQVTFDVPTMHIEHPGGGFAGSGRINDIYGCLINAGPTVNAETWGFSNKQFEEFCI